MSACEAIAASGGSVVTEQLPGRHATRLRYMHRSRLIAALSAGAVIVEAPARSSGMRTAQYAQELGRPVMAMPGPVTSDRATGCHELIRTGAALVTSAADVRSAITARMHRQQATPILDLFTPAEPECLVRTAAEAVHGRAVSDDELSQLQLDLSKRAYDALIAENDED